MSKRERIENKINELENSFGRGAFQDGLTRQKIAELKAELAKLPI